MVSLSRPSQQQQQPAAAPWLRRRGGATTTTRPSSKRSSSQSTLFKMLVFMLATILLLYIILMAVMVARRPSDGNTNHHGIMMMSAADNPLLHHLASYGKTTAGDNTMKAMPQRQKLPLIRGVRQPADDLRKEETVKKDDAVASTEKGPTTSKEDKKTLSHHHEMTQPDHHVPHRGGDSHEDAAQRQRERRHKQGSVGEASNKKEKLLLGGQSDEPMDLPIKNTSQDHVLRAYIEPIDQDEWKLKPLPVRTSTANKLTVIPYPHVTSCSNLLEQFPVDNDPSDDDPFLPWIHDVFPTHDGHYIQFVAQNKRRCRTGTTPQDTEIRKLMQPQAALFQDVPVKRIIHNNNKQETPRYRLSSHEEADPDGVSTRFICRFKPSMEETLSVYNVNYEYATWRKGGKHTFTEEGRDNKSLHTVQLLFQCPVPPALQDMVRSGTSVINDYATLFVDLIPIRTPPRYGPPEAFFPPRYKEHEGSMKFDPLVEWGDSHILPRVEDSGRWENIPICKPSLLQYEQQASSPAEGNDEGNNISNNGVAAVVKTEKDVASTTTKESKRHRLIACVWASAGYATRGERFAISDGQRRLKEWLAFNFLVGFDHIYVYDNSLAHHHNSDESSLKPVTDLFSDKVTRIVWPAKICNNNQNFADSPGERSSQYAAEASCRLRFGAHAEWLGGFDIDEYLVPLGNFSGMPQILDKLDKEGKKIISFGSWRAWPRRSLIEEPQITKNYHGRCRSQGCFEVRVPPNRTYLQTYNCDRQKGAYKEKQMPAEKQVYRPDYVKQHFVHYSTITETSIMSQSETRQAGNKRFTKRIHADPLSRFANEIDEATMLHTKAIATQDTEGWTKTCKGAEGTCRIGNPYPEGAFEANITKDEEGWIYNCYENERIENYWVPQLDKELEKLAS